jgi:hypothetical protein
MRLHRELGAPLDGRLVYVEAEYSFRFDVAAPAELLERAGGQGLASVSIGTLQIEVGVATHHALFAWGLHPRLRWVEASLPAPVSSGGVVLLGPDMDFSAGSSVALSAVGEWNTVYDISSGWLRVSANSTGGEALVEVATGVLLGSSNGELCSVWLRPEID